MWCRIQVNSCKRYCVPSIIFFFLCRKSKAHMSPVFFPNSFVMTHGKGLATYVLYYDKTKLRYCSLDSPFKIQPYDYLTKKYTSIPCEKIRVVNEPSWSWTTRARLDKKLVHVCLFINKSSLSLSFRLV